MFLLSYVYTSNISRAISCCIIFHCLRCYDFRSRTKIRPLFDETFSKDEKESLIIVVRTSLSFSFCIVNIYYLSRRNVKLASGTFEILFPCHSRLDNLVGRATRGIFFFFYWCFAFEVLALVRNNVHWLFIDEYIRVPNVGGLDNKKFLVSLTDVYEVDNTG